MPSDEPCCCCCCSQAPKPQTPKPAETSRTPVNPQDTCRGNSRHSSRYEPITNPCLQGPVQSESSDPDRCKPDICRSSRRNSDACRKISRNSRRNSRNLQPCRRNSDPCQASHISNPCNQPCLPRTPSCPKTRKSSRSSKSSKCKTVKSPMRKITPKASLPVEMIPRRKKRPQTYCCEPEPYDERCEKLLNDARLKRFDLTSFPLCQYPPRCNEMSIPCNHTDLENCKCGGVVTNKSPFMFRNRQELCTCP